MDPPVSFGRRGGSDAVRIEELSRLERPAAVAFSRPETAPSLSDFSLLTMRRLDFAYRLAWAIIGDPLAAQSATHQALAEAWRRRASLKGDHGFAAWFDAMLVAQCLIRLRRPSSASRGDGSARPQEPDWGVPESADRDTIDSGWFELLGEAPGGSPAHRDAARSIRQALPHAETPPAIRAARSLDPNLWLVAVLHYWADFTPGEVAVRLGRDLASTESRIDEASAALSELFGLTGPDTADDIRATLHRGLVPPLIAPYELRHAVENRESLRPVRSARRRRRGALAVVLSVLAVFVIALAGLMTPHGPVAAAAGKTPFDISTFSRIDAATAWVASADAIYITRDNGRTWRKGSLPATSSMPMDGGPNTYTSITFIDANDGWLVPIGTVAAQSATVYRTRDGARTWTSSDLALHREMVANMQFVDRNHGWIVATSFFDWGYQSGTDGLAVTVPDGGGVGASRLLATSDGGETWAEVANFETQIVPTFVSADEGWAISTNTAAGLDGSGTYPAPTLYHFADGGRTATSTTLSLPSGCMLQNNPLPPARNAGRLTLVVLCDVMPDYTSIDGSTEPYPYTPNQQIVTLESNDGGATWPVVDRQAVPSDTRAAVLGRGGSLRQPLLEFASSGLTVFASFDGGATWKAYDTSRPGGSYVQLEFASESDFWAMTVADGRLALWATSDGGKTWRQLSGVAPQPAAPATAPDFSTSTPPAQIPEQSFGPEPVIVTPAGQ